MDMACYTLVPNMGKEIRVRSLVKDFGYDVDDLNDNKETLAIITALTDEFKTLSKLQTTGSKFRQCSYAAKILQHASNYGQNLLIRDLYYIPTSKSPTVEIILTLSLIV